jgi:hypothetical protein
MANIKLKGLLKEAEDFQAKSKQTGKLVHFKSKDSYQAAIKAGTHEDPNAEKGAQPKADAKPNSMFGADYSKDRGGESNSDGMATVNSIAAKTGLRGQAVAGWADENGINLAKVSDDLESKKLKPFDFTTAVVGKPGNNYSKAIIAKYSNSAAPQSNANVYVIDTNTGRSKKFKDKVQAQKFIDKNGGELADFDTDGRLKPLSAMNKDVKSVQLPQKASELDYTHAETLEKSVNAETGLKGYVDTDDNTDAIMYNASKGMTPTYTLYFGGNSDYNKPDEFRVSLLPTYENDPSNLGDKIDKTFKSGDDAMKFMIAVAKKYKKELQMDDEDTNESSKLTSMFKK